MIRRLSAQDIREGRVTISLGSARWLTSGREIKEGHWMGGEAICISQVVTRLCLPRCLPHADCLLSVTMNGAEPTTSGLFRYDDRHRPALTLPPTASSYSIRIEGQRLMLIRPGGAYDGRRIDLLHRGQARRLHGRQDTLDQDRRCRRGHPAAPGLYVRQCMHPRASRSGSGFIHDGQCLSVPGACFDYATGGDDGPGYSALNVFQVRTLVTRPSDVVPAPDDRTVPWSEAKPLFLTERMCPSDSPP